MTATSPATGGTRPARALTIALWALQVVLAAAYLMSAMPKLAADPAAVAGFARLGFDPTGMLVIAVLEIAGAVGLLVPRLSGLAALGLVGLMTGAVILTVIGIGVVQAALPAVLLVLVAVVAWARRDRTAELLTAARRLVG